MPAALLPLLNLVGQNQQDSSLGYIVCPAPLPNWHQAKQSYTCDQSDNVTSPKKSDQPIWERIWASSNVRICQTCRRIKDLDSGSHAGRESICITWKLKFKKNQITNKLKNLTKIRQAGSWSGSPENIHCCFSCPLSSWIFQTITKTLYLVVIVRWHLKSGLFIKNCPRATRKCVSLWCGRWWWRPDNVYHIRSSPPPIWGGPNFIADAATATESRLSRCS